MMQWQMSRWNLAHSEALLYKTIISVVDISNSKLKEVNELRCRPLDTNPPTSSVWKLPQRPEKSLMKPNSEGTRLDVLIGAPVAAVETATHKQQIEAARTYGCPQEDRLPSEGWPTIRVPAPAW
jgi:hypothetical protein